MSKKFKRQQTAAPCALPATSAPVAAASPFIPAPEPPKRLTCTLGSAILVRAGLCDAHVTLARLQVCDGGNIGGRTV